MLISVSTRAQNVGPGCHKHMVSWLRLSAARVVVIVSCAYFFEVQGGYSAQGLGLSEGGLSDAGDASVASFKITLSFSCSSCVNNSKTGSKARR